MRTPLYLRKKLNPVPEPGTDVDIAPIFTQLQDLAWSALYSAKLKRDSVVFCVETCQLWSDFATFAANPNMYSCTRPTITEDGRFLMGLSQASLNDYAVALSPGLKERAELTVDAGTVRLLVFHSGGIMIMDIEPTSSHQSC